MTIKCVLRYIWIPYWSEYNNIMIQKTNEQLHSTSVHAWLWHINAMQIVNDIHVDCHHLETIN